MYSSVSVFLDIINKELYVIYALGINNTIGISVCKEGRTFGYNSLRMLSFGIPFGIYCRMVVMDVSVDLAVISVIVVVRIADCDLAFLEVS